jgi:hypothetical protein
MTTEDNMLLPVQVKCRPRSCVWAPGVFRVWTVGPWEFAFQYMYDFPFFVRFWGY